ATDREVHKTSDQGRGLIRFICRQLLAIAENAVLPMANGKGTCKMENGKAEKSWFRLVLVALLAISACKEEQNANQRQAVSKTPTGNITEITLERGACFGRCPVYRVTLRQGRPATYVGDAYVSLIGTYEAANDSCSECDFSKLATSMETQGFF